MPGSPECPGTMCDGTLRPPRRPSSPSCLAKLHRCIVYTTRHVLPLIYHTAVHIPWFLLIEHSYGVHMLCPWYFQLEESFDIIKFVSRYPAAPPACVPPRANARQPDLLDLGHVCDFQARRIVQVGVSSVDKTYTMYCKTGCAGSHNGSVNRSPWRFFT